MIPLSIVAAGIIAVAAAIFALPSEKPRTADQRGITLQTLIVTAVLVVMAGVAGVVIIGITQGQRDNLEEAGRTSSDANCEAWEIYDPTFAAAGRGGSNAVGGRQSSAIGCVRVCYVEFTSAAAWTAITASGDLETNGQGATGTDVTLTSSTNTGSNGALVFSRSSAYRAPANATIVRLPVNGARSVDPDGDATANDFTLDIKEINNGDSTVSGTAAERYEIRVTNDSRSCMLYDTTDNDEVFRV